jgi:hypothetical protein
MKTFGIIMTLISILNLAGCKPGDESRVKTLDQFAGGSAVYQCKGPHGNNEKYLRFFSGIKSEDQKRAVLDALSALPVGTKDRIFFGPIQSKVELTSRVYAQCKGTSTERVIRNNSAKLLTCPTVRNGSAVILVDERPSSIRSQLVRGLAYYLVGIDAKIEPQLSSPTAVTIGFVDQGDILKNKKHLGALVFLDEVAASGGTAIKSFSHLLPKTILDAKTKSERDSAYFDPRKTNAADRDAFAAYFSAEMIDSMSCSEESRKAAQRSFPKTLRFFTPQGDFALAESAQNSRQSYASAPSEGPRVAVTSRSSGDSAPAGLTPSSRIMYIQGDNGQETPTKLYERDGSQYWQGNDGTWRQSPLTTLNNGEQSVTRLDKIPSFVEPPPVSNQLSWLETPHVVINPPSPKIDKIPANQNPETQHLTDEAWYKWDSQPLKPTDFKNNNPETQGIIDHAWYQYDAPPLKPTDFKNNNPETQGVVDYNWYSPDAPPLPNTGSNNSGAATTSDSWFCRTMGWFCGGQKNSSGGTATGSW